MTHTLSIQNRESELSYAYLHAVTAYAGMDCAVSTRHQDNAGVDATITAWGQFPNSILTEVKLSIQLKATTLKPPESKYGLSYFLKGIAQYNALRSATLMIPRILVVLFLPAQEDLWIKQTPEHLILRKCAYWRSLNGAPETTNNAGVTIQLPHQNIFNAHSLKILMERIACNDPLHYDET